jgi:hypothetical protein
VIAAPVMALRLFSAIAEASHELTEAEWPIQTTFSYDAELSCHHGETIARDTHPG